MSAAGFYVANLITRNPTKAAEIKAAVRRRRGGRALKGDAEAPPHTLLAAQVAKDLGVGDGAAAAHAVKEGGYLSRLGKEIFVPAAEATAHLNAVKAGEDDANLAATCA